MKRTIFLLGICSLHGLGFAQATFYQMGFQNAQVTDVTPDGRYAAGFAGSANFRWEIGVGFTNIGGSHSAGSTFISDDGSRIGGEALDGASKRHAGYYDFSSSTWNLAAQPAGFSAVGVGNTLSGMFGMDGSGTKLAMGAYDAGLKLKPVRYDTGTSNFDNFPTLSTSNARPNDLSADGSTLVGWDSNPSTRQAAVWRNGQEVFVESVASEIQGVNSNGTQFFGFKGNIPVVWNSSFVATNMQILSGFDRGGVAFGTDDGTMQVGYLQLGTSTATRRGVIWINGQAQLLSAYATSMGANLNGFIPLSGMRITNDGSTIVGFGQTSTNQVDSFAIKVVPEPGSLIALAAGLGTVVAKRKKLRA